MTKFINYLNENKVYENIRKDCSKILGFYKAYNFNYFLWRGSRKHWSWDKIVPRKDRKPLDTPLKLHQLLDKEFQKKFGWKVRNEGVFVTSDPVTASRYGKEYIFLPANGFKYIFNWKIPDLFIRLGSLGVIDETNTLNMSKWEHHKDSIINNYESGNLVDAFRHGVEVVFKCDFYYLIDHIFIKDIIK